MNIDYEEIIKTKVPALRGRDAENNKLVLETLALHGPMIKYDVFKSLKAEGIKHYATISRRVDNLRKRGYLDVAGKRSITVGKREDESPMYSLTWRGFITCLTMKTVIGDIPTVLKKNPLLKLNLPYEVPKEVLINVMEELFTLREIGIISNAFLLGFLKALPRDIESIKQENYIAYMVPALTEAPEIKEKFEQKDLTKLLEIPGLLELALHLVEDYEEQLLKLMKGIKIIKRELVKRKSEQSE